MDFRCHCGNKTDKKGKPCQQCFDETLWESDGVASRSERAECGREHTLTDKQWLYSENL